MVKALDLNETMGITLLVVTSSPGGSYSNWWCSIFNADLALSVTMTAISTVVSIVTMPLNLLLYSKLTYDDDVVSQLDWASLFTSLVVVMGAIAIGLVCSAKVHSRRFNKVANKLGNVAGILLVLFSIAIPSFTGEADTKIWNRSWHFYVGIALPCLFGLIVANIFTTGLNLALPERVTVSVECCYQNVGIATSVALTMFDGNDLAEAMGVPLYYGLVEAVVLGVYCIIAWKLGWTKAPPKVPFCHMISNSYEVIEEEQKDMDAIEILLRSSENVEESVSENGDTLFAYYKFIESNIQTKGINKLNEIHVREITLQGTDEIYESETSESETNQSMTSQSMTNQSESNERSEMNASDISESKTNESKISEGFSRSISETNESKSNESVINKSETNESKTSEPAIHKIQFKSIQENKFKIKLFPNAS